MSKEMQDDNPVDSTNPLVKNYEGMYIRCFLNNGKVLIGKASFSGDFLFIQGDAGATSVVNLNYVVAMTAKSEDNGERQF